MRPDGPQRQTPDAPHRNSDPDAPRQRRQEAQHDGVRPQRADAPHQNAPNPHQPGPRHAGADRYEHGTVRPDSFLNVRGDDGKWGLGQRPGTSEASPDHDRKPDPADSGEQKYSTAESMAAERPPANPSEHRWDVGRAGEFERLDVSPELRQKLAGDDGYTGIRNTPSGLSVVHYPKSMLGDRAYYDRVPKPAVDPKRFTVEVHGSPDGVEFRGQQLSAKELAEIIKAAPGYDPGTPIRLLSCKTGADTPDGSPNFAQQLSKELGVEVLAPNKDAWVDNFGNMYASDSRAKFEPDAAGTPQPKLDEPGQWISFAPDGTKAVHDSPFPPGHEPEFTRHGVQAHNAEQRGIGGPPKEFQHPGGPRWSGLHTRQDEYGLPIQGHLSPTGEFVPHIRVDANGNAVYDPNGNVIRAGHVDSEGRWVPEHIDQNGNLAPDGHYEPNGQWIAHGRTDELGRWIPVHFDGQRYHDLGRFNPQTHQWEPLGRVDPNTGQFHPNPAPNQLQQAGPMPPAGQPGQPQAPQPMAAQSGSAPREQFGYQPAAAQQMPPPQQMHQHPGAQGPQTPNYQQPAAAPPGQPAPGPRGMPQQPSGQPQHPSSPNIGQQTPRPAMPQAGQQPQGMRQPNAGPQQPPAPNAPRAAQQPPPVRQQAPAPNTPHGVQRPAAPQQPGRPTMPGQQAPAPPRPAAGMPQAPMARQNPSTPQQPVPPARPAGPPPADVSGPRLTPASPSTPPPSRDVGGPGQARPTARQEVPQGNVSGPAQAPAGSRPSPQSADVSGSRQSAPEAPRRSEPARDADAPQQTPAGQHPPASASTPKPADTPQSPRTQEPGEPADPAPSRTDQQPSSWQTDFEPKPKSAEPATPVKEADSPTWREDFEPKPATDSPNGHRGDRETESPDPANSTPDSPAAEASKQDVTSDPDPVRSEPDPALSVRESWARMDVTPTNTLRHRSGDEIPDSSSDGQSKRLADFDPPVSVSESPTRSSIADRLGGYDDSPSSPEPQASDLVVHDPDVDLHESDVHRPDPDSDTFAPAPENPDVSEIIGERTPDFRATEADRQAYRERIERSRLRDMTFEEAVAELRAKYPQLAKLPDVDAVGLRRYVGEDAITMNRALRNRDEYDMKYLAPEIKVLRSALNQMPDYSGSTAYRNISVDPEDLEALLERYKPGSSIVEDGFTSASKDAPLDQFGKVDGKHRVQFVIEEPRYAKDLSFMNPDEREILWPDGNRFEVSEQYFDSESGVWKIHLIDRGRE